MSDTTKSSETGANRPVAVVTGGSSGIGRAIAVELARRGHDLVIVARDEQRLSDAARAIGDDYGVDVVGIPSDLGADGAADTLADELEQRGLTVDVLVNNAGYGRMGAFLQMDEDDQAGMIAVNDEALVRLTYRLLPGMVARGRGGILNVASTAAFQPGPYMAVYYASKAFVLFFSEALAYELKGTSVTVTCVCPGPTITGFQSRAGQEGARLVTMFPTMTPEKVARTALNALARGKRVAVPGIANKLTAWTAGITPRPVQLALIKFLQT